ncbi:N-acetyltransferase family protein [Salinicoccus sp. Marseille-QA3877]
MFLRKAEKRDLPYILNITEKVVPIMQASGNTQWSDEYPDERIFREDLEDRSLYVYEENNLIKGFAVVDNKHPYPYDDIPWELTRADSRALHRMAVSPEFQGQGIASKMMKEIESRLIAKGIKGIHTDTSLENEKMQYQFEKNGYEFKGQLNLDENLDDWYAAYEKVFEV